MNEQETTGSKTPKMLGAVIAIAAVVGMLGYFANGAKNDAEPTPMTATDTGENTSDSSTYQDGTYQATGSYVSPAGPETVDVSLTLKDDVIVAATFHGNGTNPGTMAMQGNFSKGYEAVVVGKPLDELSLTVVNGSSLTPKGFMDAVAKIKVDAQS